MNLRTLQNGLVGIYIFISLLCAFVSYRNYTHHINSSALPIQFHNASEKLSAFLATTDILKSESSHHVPSLDYVLQTTLASDGSERSHKWTGSSSAIQKIYYPFIKSISKCTSIERKFDVSYFPGLDDYARESLTKKSKYIDIDNVPIDLLNTINSNRIHTANSIVKQFIVYPLPVTENGENHEPFRIDISTDSSIIVLPVEDIPRGVISLNSIRASYNIEHAIANLIVDGLTQFFHLTSPNVTAAEVDSFCRKIQSDMIMKVSNNLERISKSENIGLFPCSPPEARKILKLVESLDQLMTSSMSDRVHQRVGILNDLDHRVMNVLVGSDADNNRFTKILSTEFQLGIHGPLLIPIILGLLRVVIPMLKGCQNTRPRKRDRVKKKFGSQKLD